MRLTILLFITICTFFLLAQCKIIYHPRPYSPADLKQERVIHLTYKANFGEQQSFYVPPRSAPSDSPKCPERVWVFFNGNGSLALEWLEFVREYPSSNDGFLLVEYPGYGACSGRPSSKNIPAGADGAVEALAAYLHKPKNELTTHLSVFGHSLGAAAAFDFASRYPVRNVVVVAPFTSLRDMAKHFVGTPLSWLLWDNYDNRARLEEIMQKNPQPSVSIIFGTNDEVIPFSMGEELASKFPQVHFIPIQGGRHNSILSQSREEIYKAMMRF